MFLIIIHTKLFIFSMINKSSRTVGPSFHALAWEKRIKLFFSYYLSLSLSILVLSSFHEIMSETWKSELPHGPCSSCQQHVHCLLFVQLLLCLRRFAFSWNRGIGFRAKDQNHHHHHDACRIHAEIGPSLYDEMSLSIYTCSPSII